MDILAWRDLSSVFREKQMGSSKGLQLLDNRQKSFINVSKVFPCDFKACDIEGLESAGFYFIFSLVVKAPSCMQHITKIQI